MVFTGAGKPLCRNFFNAEVRCNGFSQGSLGKGEAFCLQCESCVRRKSADGKQLRDLCKNAARKINPCANEASLHTATGLDAGFCHDCTRESEATGRSGKYSVCREEGCYGIPKLPLSGYCGKCLITKQGLLIDVTEHADLLFFEALEKQKTLPRLQTVVSATGPLRLVLPRRHFDLPAYAIAPHFLSPEHCRLCLQGVPAKPGTSWKDALALHVSSLAANCSQGAHGSPVRRHAGTCSRLRKLILFILFAASIQSKSLVRHCLFV